MSEPSDIESCNEKTILDKVNDHIDGILNKTSYSLWSHVKSRGIPKVVDIPVISYLYLIRSAGMAMMSALVYYILIMMILKKADENKSYVDFLLIIVPIYVNYIITLINSYLININNIEKNLIICKHFLNTHDKIKDVVKDNSWIKELLELFLNELIEFENEINSWYIACTISIYNPPKCHPLLEDITHFKDELKYAMDKDEKRNQV
jgi:hypothetical protein